MTAYNHQTQSWLDGLPGAQLMLEQLQSTLDLALSTRGIEYAKFEGFESRTALIRHLQAGIAEAQAEIAHLNKNQALASELGVN